MNRARAWLGRVPAAVWAVQALFVLLLVLSAQLFPSYRGPDETHHVDLVFALGEGEAFPEPDGRNIGRGVLVSKEVVGFSDKSRNLEAAAAPPREERLSILESGGSTPSGQYNQGSQHPPLYYRLGEAWLRGWRALGLAHGFDQTVGVLRLFSILCVAPLPLLAWATARRLGAGATAATAAAVVLVTVPQIAHIGSVVNNDSLLIGLFGLLAYLVARVLTGDRSWPTTVSVGLVASAALLTKALALVVAPWLVLVFVVVWWRSPEARAAVAARALVAAAFTSVGGAWWIRNQVVYGEVRPGGLRFKPAVDTFEPDPVGWLQLFGSRMSFRYWGHFGWADVRFPVPLVATAVAVALVLALLALVVRRPGVRRVDLVVVAAPVLLLLTLVAGGAYERYLATGLTPGIQGRYTYGGLVGAVVCIGIGAVVVFRRWAPLVLLAGGVVLQAFALVQNLRFYWGPPGGGLPSQVAAMGAWSPWFDAVPALTLGAVAVALLGLVALLGRDALGGSSSSSP